MISSHCCAGSSPAVKAPAGAVDATGAPPVLQTCQLCVGYPGVCLLQGVNFDLQRGQLVAVMGPSGSGKTSLLRCLAGLIDPVEGRVVYRLAGDSPARDVGPGELRGKLGLVFQHLRLTPNASVLTNVLCGVLGKLPGWRTLWGFPRQDCQRARELLAALDLEGYGPAPVAKISGGERQRVAIARALMGRPSVLLADEPVSHLDRSLARRVLGFLKEITRREGMAVVCVLHDRGLAQEFADAVWEVGDCALAGA